MKYTFFDGEEEFVLTHIPDRKMLYLRAGAFPIDDSKKAFQNWKITNGGRYSLDYGNNAKQIFSNRYWPEYIRDRQLTKGIRRTWAEKSPLLPPPTMCELFKTERGELTGMLNEYIVAFGNDDVYKKLKDVKKLGRYLDFGSGEKIWAKDHAFVFRSRRKGLNPFFEDLKGILDYKSEGLLYAHPNFVGLLQLATTDPNYDKQWALNPTSSLRTAQTVRIDIESAWAQIVSRGLALTPTKVMVLDQGIFPHSDLLFSPVLPSSTSALSHGTRVTGVLGALQNSAGISGISPASSMALTYFNIYGQNFPPQYDSIANAAMAVDQATWVKSFLQSVKAASPKPRVLNMSFNILGYPGTKILKSTIDDLAKDMLICVSTGNYSGPTSTGDFEDLLGYPAYLSEVLPVGAIDQNGCRVSKSKGHAWSSKYGFPGGIGLVAPGIQIYTTDRGSGSPLAYFEGTSAATAYVSGVAALLFAVRPSLTPSAVKKLLLDSATLTDLTKVGAGADGHFLGKGCVQAGVALTKLLSP